MTDMKSFVMWFIDNIPDFFMSEPIIYIFGFVLLAFVISIVFRITRIK